MPEAQSRLLKENRHTSVELGERIVREPGSEQSAGFCAEEWLDDWLQSPLLAFGGSTPTEVLQTVGGLTMVSRHLERVQSGAYS
jgi:uncharacterized protein (DUF2384 family)